jgi:hypothetical protein
MFGLNKTGSDSVFSWEKVGVDSSGKKTKKETSTSRLLKVLGKEWDDGIGNY